MYFLFSKKKVWTCRRKKIRRTDSRGLFIQILFFVGKKEKNITDRQQAKELDNTRVPYIPPLSIDTTIHTPRTFQMRHFKFFPPSIIHSTHLYGKKKRTRAQPNTQDQLNFQKIFPPRPIFHMLICSMCCAACLLYIFSRECIGEVEYIYIVIIIHTRVEILNKMYLKLVQNWFFRNFDNNFCIFLFTWKNKKLGNPVHDACLPVRVFPARQIAVETVPDLQTRLGPTR